MKRYITLALVAAMTVSANAQDMQKEITVDRTVQPQLREATRLSGAVPKLLSPDIAGKRLNAAEYTKAGKLTNEAAQLPPAPWHDSIPLTPWRGYASLGYFPWLNIGANAGYRLIRTSKTDAGVWMQYNKTDYKGYVPNYDDAPMGQQYITVGADGTYWLGKSQVALDLEYTRAGVKHPYTLIENGYRHDGKYNQSADIFDGQIGWEGKVAGLHSHASVGYGYFNFNECAPIAVATVLPAISQMSLDFDLGAGVTDGDDLMPWLGADVDWKVLRSGGMEQYYNELRYYDVVTMTLGHLRPYLLFGDDGALSGRVGLNLSVATGNNNGHLRIAPDVEIDWRPARWATIYGKAKGGEHFNTMRTLFDQNPYIMTTYGYERTNVALDLEGGFTASPLPGFTLRAFGGYALTRDQLTPMLLVSSGGLLASLYNAEDINCWRLGAGGSYACSLFRLSGEAQIAGSNKDHAAWYTSADGARLMGKVDLDVYPYKNLAVNVGLDVRARRRAMMIDYMSNPVGAEPAWHSLGRQFNLNVGANYKVTPQITAFGMVDNLLNKRYYLISGYPAQGITGMLGAAYKF